MKKKIRTEHSVEHKLRNHLHIPMGAMLQQTLIESTDERKLTIAKRIDSITGKLLTMSSIKRLKFLKHNYEHCIKTFKPYQNASCKKGCSNCCYQNVTIFESEAKFLSKKYKEKLIAKREELTKQKDIENKQPRKCVFLENGECSIYEDRPFTCKKYFVKSDPKDCDVINKAGKVVSVISCEPLEYFEGSMYEIENADSMANMLLKYLPSQKGVK